MDLVTDCSLSGQCDHIRSRAAAYDEEAVLEISEEKQARKISTSYERWMSGSRMRQMKRETTAPTENQTESQLQQWPVQIKLVPTQCTIF